MNTSQDSNIYEFNAASALAAYEGFVEGTPNCTLAVISQHPLSPEAHAALASSAERLGFGHDGVFWVVSEREDGATLDARELQELLMGCDPLAYVAMDASAALLLGAAFDTPCTLDGTSRLQGRTAVAFTSFQEMLASPEAKQRAWSLLKKLG